MKCRFILLIVYLLLWAVDTLATGHWTVNPYAFQYDMTVYVSLAGVSQDDYEVAAIFEGECRGVGKLLTAGDGSKVFQLRIRSNEATGENITFSAYNTTTEEELPLGESIIFESQTVVGTPSNPLVLKLGIILLGDVNGDGIITAQDASLVQQLVAKKITATTEGIVYDAADVNADGMVTAQDASLIQQHVAKKIDISTINN